MAKIRINELARELEVKPGVILEMLPEVGVTDKKTHSSTIDEALALELRDRVVASGAPPDRSPSDTSEPPDLTTSVEQHPPVEASSQPKSHQAQETAPVKQKPDDPTTQGAVTPHAEEKGASAHAAEQPETQQPMSAQPEARVPSPQPLATGKNDSPAASHSPSSTPASRASANDPATASESSPSRGSSIQVPTLPPPISDRASASDKGKNRPIAPPLPPPLQRKAAPITPPLQANAEGEGDATRRPASLSSLLPPPLKPRPAVEAKTSVFRQDGEEQQVVTGEVEAAVPAAPTTPTLPSPISAPQAPAAPQAPTPQPVAAQPERGAPALPEAPAAPAAPAAPVAPAALTVPGPAQTAATPRVAEASAAPGRPSPTAPAPVTEGAPAAPATPVALVTPKAAAPSQPGPALPTPQQAPALPTPQHAAPVAPQAPAAQTVPPAASASPLQNAPTPTLPAPSAPAAPAPALPSPGTPAAAAPMSPGRAPQTPRLPNQRFDQGSSQRRGGVGGGPLTPPRRGPDGGQRAGGDGGNAPRPGEILRSLPQQPAPGIAIPPTRLVAPGPGAQSAKQGEGSASEAARRLPLMEGAGRPAPGQARPPVPNRPTPVARQVARPIVPPTPEMVERLKQFRSAQGPAPQRPGVPAKPRPGEPIYGGPVKTGQPLDRNRVPGRPSGPISRGRGMHPTSAPLLPDVGPVPSTPGRKPGAGAKRSTDRGRRHDREEKELLLRPSRRREPEAPPPITREITISEGITVKELSEKLEVKASLIIKKLLDRKIFATINQTLDSTLADEISRAFGAGTTQVSYEEESIQDAVQLEVEADKELRPPVVTIMGHVDHGKTSLLDAIRMTRVADREAGGITQHIGAYSVQKDGKTIVFVDTPGHEAFTRMRARGAKVTDIVILVVSADDGVMPQTEEAIRHARAAEVPIIVAINKIDKPGANPERVKQQLTDKGLMPEDWGGDTVMVPVSAKTGQNLDLLLEMILLSAEMLELRATNSRPALCTILEAQLDRGKGPVATVIVRNGTLRPGDYYICGPAFGRVRAMFDDAGVPVKEAGPSMPVQVLGLENVPEVGDTLQVVTDTAKAKQIALYRESKARDVQMAKSSKITLERFHTTLREGESKELLIVLKADVGGTAEVIAETLEKLSNDKVRLRVILTGVGAITESDVLLASASNAIVIGFNVRPDKNATALASQENVDIRQHSIIYELTDEVKQAMTGMLEPVYKEVFRGRAEVRDVFRITKVGTIAGCLVTEGSIPRDAQVRLLRDNTVVHTGKISSLKRFKDDASEVKTNMECGIGIDRFNDVKPGDVIEAFIRERVQVEAFV